MNEKIREFAEQATEFHYETYDSYNQKSVKHYRFNKEKFAELIVRECVGQLQELTPMNISNENHQKLVDASYKAAVDIGVHKIKKHFGVEE